MGMTKKDYIGIADALRPALNREHATADGVVTLGPARIVDALADYFEQTNPLFKRDRWLDYLAGKAGPNGGKGA